jgi:hypothetical protein
MATLRENIRVRKLAQEIKKLQAEIDSEDIDGAAKAKRNFHEKYGPAKEKENKLQTAVRIHRSECYCPSDIASSMPTWLASLVRAGANSRLSKVT